MVDERNVFALEAAGLAVLAGSSFFCAMSSEHFFSGLAYNGVFTVSIIVGLLTSALAAKAFLASFMANAPEQDPTVLTGAQR